MVVSNVSLLKSLRKNFHNHIQTTLISFDNKSGRAFPNFADGNSKSSVAIANALCNVLGWSSQRSRTHALSGQTIGKSFVQVTRDFVENAFQKILHLRPGHWSYRTETEISAFVQYRHLAELARMLREHRELSTTLGHDYLITADIVMLREPLDDHEINQDKDIVRSAEEEIAYLTPLRAVNQEREFKKTYPILHASISCKWTIRSDRAQNARSEALNLIRHRKGHMPHIVVVTAEPLPTRIASLALGTGDLDCVYHIALPELESVCSEWPDQLDMLNTMVKGSRLRDISDLPFDLAI